MKREEFLNYIDTLTGEIKFHSLEELKGFDFVSKESITILVSGVLLKDIKYIDEFIERELPHRYVSSLIRNLCEMVIEYIYVIEMDDEKLFERYLGIADDDYLKGLQNKNSIKGLSQFGKNRFGEARKSVSEMATIIKMKNGKDGKVSLYDIFAITSDSIHNIVLFSNFDLIDQIETVSDITDNGLDYTFVIDIVGAFIECYKEVFS